MPVLAIGQLLLVELQTDEWLPHDVSKPRGPAFNNVKTLKMHTGARHAWNLNWYRACQESYFDKAELFA